MPVPEELKRNLPRLQQEFADTRLWLYIGTPVYGAALYFAGIFPSLWVRGTPSIGALVAALVLTLWPLNPYVGVFEAPRDVIARDAAAQRLLSMLRSRDALKVLWITAVATSLSFLAVVLLVSIVTRAPALRELQLEGTIIYVGLWALITPIIFYNRLLNWAFGAWHRQN